MKGFLKESGKLLSNGLELVAHGATALADAMDDLHKKSSILNAESAVDLQLTIIKHLSDNNPKQLASEYNVLIEHLNYLLELKPEDSIVITHINDAKSKASFYEQQRYDVKHEFYPDGSLKKRIRRRDGLLHGICESWYKDKTELWSIDFLDGNPEGIANVWYPNGKHKIEIKFYNKGQFREVTQWYDNGTLLAKSIHDDMNSKAEFNSFLINGLSLGKLKYKNDKRQTFLLAYVFKRLFNINFIRMVKKEKELKEMFDLYDLEFKKSFKFVDEFLNMY